MDSTNVDTAEVYRAVRSLLSCSSRCVGKLDISHLYVCCCLQLVISCFPSEYACAAYSVNR